MSVVTRNRLTIGRWKLEQFFRDGLETFWHQSGTAKMGGDAMSVVDGETTTAYCGM
jgi:choline dehydrogenase-like flavoprotein